MSQPSGGDFPSDNTTEPADTCRALPRRTSASTWPADGSL